MFKKVPRNVAFKVGTITILSTLKDDLELFLKYVQEKTGEPTTLGEVIAFCIDKTVRGDRDFLKYRKEQAAGQ